jgi:hypothetical protein
MGYLCMGRHGHSHTSEASGGRALGVMPVGSSTRVQRTYAGDAKLDRQVTIADLGILAANWRKGVEPSAEMSF